MIVADSTQVTAKADQLAAEYRGNGVFAVASGSRVGKSYTVTLPAHGAHPDRWGCTCSWAEHGGRLCSHVRAATREAERICRKNGTTPSWRAA